MGVEREEIGLGNCTGNPGGISENPIRVPVKSRTQLVFKGGGVVVVGCSRKIPTTLENEHKQLVFEGGNGDGVLRAYDTTFEGGGSLMGGN